MQFLIVAYDGTDEQAAQRRKEAQEAHRSMGLKMVQSRNIIFSTAILDDSGETIGSMRVMQFESRDDLDDWLKIEPYVLANVWQDIDIRPCRMGPAFEWMTLDSGETKLDFADNDADEES